MERTPDWQLIRNRTRTCGSPASVAKMERFYDLLEHVGVGAVGVDPSPVLAMALANADERIPDANVTWLAAKCEDVALDQAALEFTIFTGLGTPRSPRGVDGAGRVRACATPASSA
jgi:hypothetical protein